MQLLIITDHISNLTAFHMQIAQSLEILLTTTHPNHPCIACSAFSLILIKKCHARGKWACLCCNVLVRREMHSSAIKAELKSITFYGGKNRIAYVRLENIQPSNRL